MASPERRIDHSLGAPLPKEFLDPRHHYAAFLFRQAETRSRDVTLLIDVARDLECGVRYWWQSEAHAQEEPAIHLCVGVHCPSPAEEAGLTILETLTQTLIHYQVTWDGVLPQAGEEYRRLGQSILSGMYMPDGTLLFPERPAPPTVVYTITHGEIQFVAQGMLGRALTEAELEAVGEKLRRTVNWLSSVEGAIRLCQALGVIEQSQESAGEARQSERRAPIVREVAGWPECHVDDEVHLCNQAASYEGIDYDGQLYIRSDPPQTRQGIAASQTLTGSPEPDWEPWFSPSRGDTLEIVLAHLDELVEDDLISVEEHARSEAFYRRLFQG